MSCEGVNILETPLEAVFVTLAKKSWNEKLKFDKKTKIRRACFMISGIKCPPEPVDSHKIQEKQLKENHCLLFMRELYRDLLKMLPLT